MANGWEAIVDEVLALQATPGDWRPGPSVQWFYKQWLGDSVVMVMSMTARGCHHHLIMMACQESPPCSIPDDDLVLRGWCQHPADWPELWAQIRRAWRLHGGRWWQIGLCRSYLEAMRLRVVRRGVGGKGGRPKVAHEEPTAFAQKAIALNGKPIALKPTSSSSASASSSAEDRESEKSVPNGTLVGPMDRRAILREEIEWRVSECWRVHLAMRERFYHRRNGDGKTGQPPELTKQIRLAIRGALAEHDHDRLGPEDRDRWTRESPVRAAGIGLFLSPWHTASDDRNKTYYLEPWRPWRQQRGKADPVPTFADLYFAQRQREKRS